MLGILRLLHRAETQVSVLPKGETIISFILGMDNEELDEYLGNNGELWITSVPCSRRVRQVATIDIETDRLGVWANGLCFFVRLPEEHTGFQIGTDRPDRDGLLDCRIEKGRLIMVAINATNTEPAPAT